ncbi:hypothetical protein [Streptomyces sp. BH055]|uniref:hypothetical protein n=1 Tax=Streptomyces sp. BH055 TaxID=3401173 RepID=UPI003BB7BE89
MSEAGSGDGRGELALYEITLYGTDSDHVRRVAEWFARYVGQPWRDHTWVEVDGPRRWQIMRGGQLVTDSAPIPLDPREEDRFETLELGSNGVLASLRGASPYALEDALGELNGSFNLSDDQRVSVHDYVGNDGAWIDVCIRGDRPSGDFDWSPPS